ncbi:hypothetical protein BPT24_299 [Tenacibaculum phage pT24]|uniref:Uncharacterized protein n=1 Tax=Tenacibaculum phage pT24 TaxID=1880590 RepID=A0A1B4XX83_9CAUD|nr:hypothetical protein HYP10_gp228 [Tenacibaculum phage pT24]BAV39417.1 hypothetical protein BPT24_299 [Tenacibaculum phage pT24]
MYEKQVYPKFIILVEDGVKKLVIGKCTFHKELVPQTDRDKIISGGWFEYDIPNKKFHLMGDSSDFGEALREDIEEAVLNDEVYSGYLIRKFDNHKFSHNNGFDTVDLN